MATPAVTEPSSPDNRIASDFTLAWVLDVLVKKKLLTKSQAQDIAAKEPQARARVVKASGVDRYEVSPVEIVAAFQVPLQGKTGEVLDQDRITEAVAEAAGIAYRKVDQLRLDMAVAARISKPYAQKRAILPLEAKPLTGLVVAVANPFDRMLFEDLQRQTGGKVTVVLSSKADILKGIADVYGFKRTLAAAADDFAVDSGGVSNFEQLITLSTGKELDAQDKPVIQAVDYVLRYAFENRASDIHVEPKRDKSLVRLRIDGVLHTVYTLPAQVHAPITSRVKMISRIDISGRRKPQDGRIKVDREGREVEIRVSTLPTAFGEKTVMRIFDPETLVPDIAMLGFDPDEKKHFESWIAEPHGLILVTGPTGSGKTTTLYSSLKQLATPEVNVCTVEDPIEMIEPAFNQMQVENKIGVDFAHGVRTLLRQDPDIIMVGEIRDKDTADMAVQAALTGHLVLSTLHTNDAPSAVTRLLDLGVPGYLINSTLLGVMAQRLIRTLCRHCKKPVDGPDDDAWRSITAPYRADKPSQVMGAVGCLECRMTGYLGRMGLYEIMSMSPALRKLVHAEAEDRELREQAYKDGMKPLRVSGAMKVAQGMTTTDEVLKVAPII